MFQRGQKIIVLKSDAPRRSHPAVGDIGYLSNAYLFFKDRFILLDILFLSYKSDIKIGKDRCERKRFLVDMGINKKLKYKLSQIGIPKKFFVENQYVANLTPAGYLLDERGYIESPNRNSMWTRRYNKNGENLLGTCVKIPCGQIATVPHNKKPLNEESSNTVKCWVKCLSPLLVAEMGPFADNNYGNSISTIYDMVSRIYYSTLGSVLLNKTTISNESVLDVIKGLRKVQVLSEFFLNSCDENFLNNVELNRCRGTINMVWGAKGSIECLIKNNKIPRRITNATVSIFFRSLLTTKDTKDQLLKMRAANILPWSNASINSRSKRLEEIKLEVNSDSAALNRIFGENLF